MNKELAPRNIVVLFDSKTSEEFIKFSSEVNKVVPSKIFLNTSDMLPHMTIYSTNYPEHNLLKVEKALLDLTKTLRPFKARFIKKSIMVGSVFIDAELSDELYILHSKVVDVLNPFREGLYDENETKLSGFTEEMRKSLINYGMWAAKELYVPHVSIARPIDSQRYQEALDLLPENIYYEANIDSISLVERGPNGTCKKVIKTFHFKH